MSDAPPAAGRIAEQPIDLDVEGKDIQGEGARLRDCKPAARVELPDHVPALGDSQLQHYPASSRRRSSVQEREPAVRRYFAPGSANAKPIIKGAHQ